MDFNKWNVFWSICFGVMAFMVIAGNAISIVILSTRRLRKRPHFLLISLAIADFLVGLLAIPVYMIVVISGAKLASKLALDCVDMFTGFASTFTLAIISLERLNAIARPLHHRQLTLWSYSAAISLPWVLSSFITSFRVLLDFLFITVHQFLTIIIISLSTPLLISCISYSYIWKKQRTRIRNSFRQRHETRFSKTVFLITGTFLVTWMPFQILVIVFILCFPCRAIPVSVVFVIKLIQFSNSIVNFLIYCFRMPSYRRSLFAILSHGRDSRKESRAVFPFNENQTTNITLISFSSLQQLTIHDEREKWLMTADADAAPFHFPLGTHKKKTLKDNKILNHSLLKAMSFQEWKIARGNTEFRKFFCHSQWLYSIIEAYNLREKVWCCWLERNYAIDDFVKKNPLSWFSVDWTYYYFGIVVREDPMQEWY